MHTWIDVAILASVECVNDALLPNFSKAQKKAAVDLSREFINDLIGLDDIAKFVCTGASMLHKRKLKEGVASYRLKITAQSPLLERVLSRYSSRIDIGFVINNDASINIDIATQVLRVLSSVLNLEIDAGTDNEILELALALPSIDWSEITRSSLKTSLTGGLSEATCLWDTKLLSIVDHEYDIPYLQTIVLKLEARIADVEALNACREAISPEDYERLRSYILKRCLRGAKEGMDESVFDQAILPY